MLDFVIRADKIMNDFGIGGIAGIIRNLLSPNYIGQFLIEMRKTSYYKHQKGLFNKILFAFHLAKYERLGKKLGFTIGYDALGYGVVLPHYGTIVIGGTNRIGNYAAIHTSTCISDNGKIIGDGLYLAAGAVITSKIKLGDNISIGANSLVNKDCEQNNVLLGGMPAKVIRPQKTWYAGDSDYKKSNSFASKVKKIEELKKQYGF